MGISFEYQIPCIGEIKMCIKNTGTTIGISDDTYNMNPLMNKNSK